MSLSAERIAIADRAILQTFERSSVAWQTVPHWDTGDRGQSGGSLWYGVTSSRVYLVRGHQPPCARGLSR